MNPRRREGLSSDNFLTVFWLDEARYSQSVEKGLAVLGCFTSKRPVLGVNDVARKLEMSHSTTHRYMTTLAALGYLEQDRSRRYRLTLRVTKLGMSAFSSIGIRDQSHRCLEELHRYTSYTAGLAILDGPEILYVDHARSARRGQHAVDLSLRVGSRLPAYCTSMGKVLLANLPEAEQRDLIGNMTLTRCGPNSITSKKALRTELEHVLDKGMAVNDEELAPGLISIAVPLRAESREVIAAVNLVAHISMISLEQMVDKLLPHLVATAGNISARLGHRRDDESTL